MKCFCKHKLTMALYDHVFLRKKLERWCKCMKGLEKDLGKIPLCKPDKPHHGK